MSRSREEENLQRAVASYLRRAMPDDIYWTAVESSGRGARDGARQKAKGVNPGCPDLLFFLSAGRMVGIELKSAKGRLTGAQPGVCKAFETCGHHYHVARCVEDVACVLAAHRVALSAWPAGMRRAS